MKQKGLAPLLVIVLVAVIAVGGYLLYQKQTKPVSQLVVQPTPISAEESTDWKTYTNEKYNYQFDYPTNWYIQTLGDSEVYLSDQKLDIKNGMDSPSLQYDLIDISYIPANQIDMQVTAPVGTQQKLSQFLYIQKISDLKIGERPGAKINFVDQQNNNKNQSQTAYWIGLDDGKLQISATSSAKLKMIDQILSTFRFN
ncbi:MAG: PsbP-related protein [Candidatus Daviesbacteria bacterium]|nr:PsbP-related protein [Candidatus Daviesbacteria bacterium]